jgi:hypothetical protein
MSLPAINFTIMLRQQNEHEDARLAVVIAVESICNRN